MLINITRFIQDELLYNGHLQSLGAAGIVYVSSTLVLGKNPDIFILALVYIVFQFVYLQDRYRDITHDELSNIKRTKHLKKYLYKVPLILLSLLLVVILINVYFANYVSLAFSVAIIIMGYFYTAHVKRWTRKVYFIKDVYVSVVFSLLVVFPFIYYSEGISRYELLVFFSFFVLVESLFNQITLDIKDIVTDSKNKLLTLPIVIGRDNSIRMLSRASIIYGVLFAVFAVYYQYSGVLLSLIIISMLVNQAMIFVIRKDDFRGYMVTASKFFLWFLVVATIKFVL